MPALYRFQSVGANQLLIETEDNTINEPNLWTQTIGGSPTNPAAADNYPPNNWIATPTPWAKWRELASKGLDGQHGALSFHFSCGERAS